MASKKRVPKGKAKKGQRPFGAQGGDTGNTYAKQKMTPQGPGQNRPFSTVASSTEVPEGEVMVVDYKKVQPPKGTVKPVATPPKA